MSSGANSPVASQPRDEAHGPEYPSASHAQPGATEEQILVSTQDLGPGVTDRVFPVRSLVSFDPSPPSDSQSQSQTNPLSPAGTARQYSIIDSETWNQIQSQSDTNTDSVSLSGEIRQTPDDSCPTSQLVSEISSNPESNNADATEALRPRYIPSSDDDHQPRLVTTRFRHIVTSDGHAVVTGRTVDSFKACEDEPIHIPGAIQSFGALVALREEADEKLSVRIAKDQADLFLDHVDFVRDEGYDPSVDGPEVFILTINQPVGHTGRVWCAIHVSPSTDGLIVCEFELEDDQSNPFSTSGRASPTGPADTMGVQPTPEQLAGSTVNTSQPLRILRRARRRKGEAAAMEVFSIVSQIQEQLSRAENMETLMDITVGIAKELTGFHRVLVYQFDSEFNGKVIAELVDPTMSIDLYKGLHFPAADIPKQARELYRINKVRLLYDRDQVTARLVCRTLKDLETPLDMTHAYLRAMSPIHIKYLANMAVRSSMSISINGPSDLWGLISLHSYGGCGMRVSFAIRKMCRLIGDTVSRNIERLSYASRLQARKLINTVPTGANPSGYIVASSDDLLRLFDADYGALCIREETKILAKSAHSQEMLALVEFLKVRRFNSVVSSNHIVKDFRDLHYPPGFKDISGMLYVPLSTHGIDFIVFFRKGQLTEVKWGGNPYGKKFTDGHLEPRKSFQTWSETVLDQSREWTESEVDTAAVLCLVYGKFIKVWRQQEAVLESSNLTRLLLANSAHEVRTPLNAIVNYLEIALEGALDTETRDHLTKSYSASKSLIYVINDLLDLTNVEQGQDLIKDESFDLRTTFTQATDMFNSEAARKKLNYTVLSHPEVPETVIGDQRRVRQAMTNIISNAIQHTSVGGVTVEIWSSRDEVETEKATVNIAVLDTGPGIPSDKLEALFQELEQISADDDSYYFDGSGPDSSDAASDSREKNVLGLGLALVARIVRNMHGQLSVRSEEGKGSRFQISLRFSVPKYSPQSESNISHLAIRTVDSATAFPSKEDIVLVGSTSSSQKGGSHGSVKNGTPSMQTEKREVNPKVVRRQNAEPQTSSDADEFRTGKCSPVASREGVISSLASKLSETPSPLAIPQVAERERERDRASTQALDRPLGSPPLSGAGCIPNFDPRMQGLNVLVAEDDPINAKILQKRLGKTGCAVHLTVNGEEVARAYRDNPRRWDVVLMDMQMPILDGIDSTKRIRQFENESTGGQVPTGGLIRRVPIFIVSASLLEKDAQMYMDVGFNGWIMKPINFARLNTLLAGLHSETARNNATYQPGDWENGGWFTPYTKS
ncbi:hypothetical protein ARAM_006917 [Aspergillus rambellii]|uniref:Sensor histidine kinase/response regulator n=1 Tax=Aspergillus rambellii TaxID=308745 RepID=A0A0F8WNP3_9EURO|nr:hypothetical protein ARAM_006917 [Aspergillus rambellii]